MIGIFGPSVHWTKVIATIVLVLLLAWFFLVGIHVFSTHFYTYVLECEGIDHFFSDTGFEHDVVTVVDTALRNNRMREDIYTLGKPEDIYNNMTVGCKTISSSIMCLSRLYNKTCGFYTTFGFKLVSNKFIGHLGVICMNNEGMEVKYF